MFLFIVKPTFYTAKYAIKSKTIIKFTLYDFEQSILKLIDNFDCIVFQILGEREEVVLRNTGENPVS